MVSTDLSLRKIQVTHSQEFWRHDQARQALSPRVCLCFSHVLSSIAKGPWMLEKRGSDGLETSRAHFSCAWQPHWPYRSPPKFSPFQQPRTCTQSLGPLIRLPVPGAVLVDGQDVSLPWMGAQGLSVSHASSTFLLLRWPGVQILWGVGDPAAYITLDPRLAHQVC